MRRILLALLVLVLTYFAVTTFLVATWMGKDERPSADAIVVLGAAQYDGRPSAIYKARLEHAVDLYNQKLARVVVVSDPFHMYRAVRQARDLGLEAYPSPTRTSPLSASKIRLTESVIREDVAIGGYIIARRG